MLRVDLLVVDECLRHINNAASHVPFWGTINSPFISQIWVLLQSIQVGDNAKRNRGG
jgi:hypothetical protein